MNAAVPTPACSAETAVAAIILAIVGLIIACIALVRSFLTHSRLVARKYEPSLNAGGAANL